MIFHTKKFNQVLYIALFFFPTRRIARFIEESMKVIVRKPLCWHDSKPSCIYQMEGVYYDWNNNANLVKRGSFIRPRTRSMLVGTIRGEAYCAVALT